MIPDRTDAAAVAIDDLTISYRRRGKALRVVSGVSLSIATGEAYGLVGESGCGKTTVAMALMRYLPGNAVVERGEIRFGGRDVLAASEDELRSWRGDRLAMVYQNPGSALNPSMRVGEQVAEVYRYHGGLDKAAALAAAQEMLERVRLTDTSRLVRRYPHELSGGQQQRVVIAMALASDPDLLVLDEPTTGLDATVEAEVLDLVERLRAEFNASILFISHNLAVVARLCDRVGVLYAGRLIEEGAARELFTAPQHQYTKALLRCVPRIGMRKDTLRLDPIPGSLPPLGAHPPGCVFAPRCPAADALCTTETPAMSTDGQQQRVACHYPDRDVAAPPAATAIADDAAASDVLLAVDELSTTYRSSGYEVKAVAGVSFEIRTGETFGLVGESGCGKSSLAKTLVGLADASGGAIDFAGTDVSSTGARTSGEVRKQIQMIFQNPDTALNPRHTVRRILRRALQRLAGVRSSAAREQQAVDLAASVRLEPRHLEVRPPALSGGLKQRVAIARAFAGDPQLVLCDESVSALDVSVQAAILNLLIDLQARKGVSYLFISHDLAVVRYLADRIGVMYLGQLVDVGPAEAVFAPPHHPYTEALASAMPSLDLDVPRARLELGGSLPSPANPPAGCRFHTRCPRVLGEICRTEEPPWQGDPAGNRYRCHIPPDDLRELQLAAIEVPPERPDAAAVTLLKPRR